MLTGNDISIPYYIDNQGDRLSKRDTASTDPETGDEETRYTGQRQGTVDITFVITEAKQIYDIHNAMLPTLYVEELCSVGVLERIQRNIDLSKSDNDKATSNPLVAIPEYGSYTA